MVMSKVPQSKGQMLVLHVLCAAVAGDKISKAVVTAIMLWQLIKLSNTGQ
jgi:hypothetical protein